MRCSPVRPTGVADSAAHEPEAPARKRSSPRWPHIPHPLRAWVPGLERRGYPGLSRGLWEKYSSQGLCRGREMEALQDLFLAVAEAGGVHDTADPCVADQQTVGAKHA